MNLKLTDKTALVSGSTKGIGFAIATGLAREGARVIVNGRCEKAVAEAKSPGMKQRNSVRIIFISSESAINTPAEMIHYGMTKTAQLAVSRGLAQSCAGTGVTVNTVLPGPTRSPGVEEFAAQLSGGKPFAEFETEFFKTVRPSSLLKRFATTEEVANLVTYVCSPLSAATNGAALRVDGGVIQACFRSEEHTSELQSP